MRNGENTEGRLPAPLDLMVVKIYLDGHRSCPRIASRRPLQRQTVLFVAVSGPSQTCQSMLRPVKLRRQLGTKEGTCEDSIETTTFSTKPRSIHFLTSTTARDGVAHAREIIRIACGTFGAQSIRNTVRLRWEPTSVQPKRTSAQPKEPKARDLRLQRIR